MGVLSCLDGGLGILVTPWGPRVDPKMFLGILVTYFLFMPHRSEVIVRLARPEPDPVTMTAQSAWLKTFLLKTLLPSLVFEIVLPLHQCLVAGSTGH